MRGGQVVVVVLLVSVSPRHIWGACKIYSAAKKGERKGEKKIKKEGLQIKSGGSLADFHTRAPPHHAAILSLTINIRV